MRNTTGETQRKLLLPISGGISSSTLLNVLDGHVGGQFERTGRAGFEIHVLLVYTTTSDKEQSDLFLDAVKLRYPRHKYHTSELLHDLGQPSNEMQESLNSDAENSNGTASTSSRDLTTLLTALPSSTSRSDILNISLTRTITQIANDLSCEAILWGSTTTRLAERILAETAKGRGFSLPWLVNDGESPYYGLHFLYPMKDLLRRELPPFAEVVHLPILQETDIQNSTAVSSKNVTIDGLMKEYFESVEENYPSIVTNVVRTSSKLTISTNEGNGSPCGLCGMLVSNDAFGLHGWGGSDEPREVDIATSQQPRDLCYGCARSLLNVPKARTG